MSRGLQNQCHTFISCEGTTVLM